MCASSVSSLHIKAGRLEAESVHTLINKTMSEFNVKPPGAYFPIFSPIWYLLTTGNDFFGEIDFLLFSPIYQYQTFLVKTASSEYIMPSFCLILGIVP